MAEENTSTENSSDDQYVVLARKYRPQNFDDLVGQDALVQTLTNAIKNNRLHHAAASAKRPRPVLSPKL